MTPPGIHNGKQADWLWPGLLAVAVALAVVARWLPVFGQYPAELSLPVTDWINSSVAPAFKIARPLGRGMTGIIETLLDAIRAVLVWLPWPAVIAATTLVALRAGGWRLAAFACLSLCGIVAVGYWPKTMNTLALVLISVPVSLVLGFALGAVTHRHSRIRSAVILLLDVMQTYPAFGYLIPLLLLFGFGPAAGLVASIVFSVPPMVRNTLVGLEGVPSEIVESATMAGAKARQLFWLVRVPSALPQLLIGLNQTTMASLSMVIIVAIIGGFDDMGWEVLAAMRKAEMGRSLAAGLVIVVLAILLDRMTRGLALQGDGRKRPAISARGLLIGLVTLGFLAPLMKRMGWTMLPGDDAQLMFRQLDRLLLDFVGWSAPFFAVLRDAITYGIMLPMRLGFSGSASPMVWGFALTPAVMAAYIALSAGLMLLAGRHGRQAATATGFAALLFWTGLPGFPWPGVFIVAGVAAWRSGGAGLFLLAVSGLLIAGLSGMWVAMMQSIYLCAVAVAICFVIGGAIGVAAAQSDRLSAILRPLNDTLQTMPQFVFLIPALMLFKVGEFTALIAIVLYTIVPPIRYVEHGLRNLRPDLIEAARQMGASPRQLLWWVKLPLARPSIRLGLNQTVMAAVSMLVIAALVGTRELGQQVYVALGKADAGMGLVAGWIIACIALVADRLLRLPDGAPSGSSAGSSDP